MKNLLTIALFLMAYSVSAQVTKIPFSKGYIVLREFVNVTIQGYDGTEVIIEEYPGENFHPNQKKGLTLLSSRVEENMPQLKYEIKGERMVVEHPYPFATFVIKVPRSVGIQAKTHDVQMTDGSNKEFVIENINGPIEVFMDGMVNVTAKNITNATSILTHGNIDVFVKSIPSDALLSFDTYRGYVDLDLPTNASLNANLSAKEGAIYSNLDFKKNTKEANPVNLRGTFGDGIASLIINTEIGGNIYIRKH